MSKIPTQKIYIRLGKSNNRKINVFNDAKAVKDADVVFSDKVISLNDKVNKKKKIKDFNSFKINKKLMSYAKKIVPLHCLPRGPEVDDKVFKSKNSSLVASF